MEALEKRSLLFASFFHLESFLTYILFFSHNTYLLLFPLLDLVLRLDPPNILPKILELPNPTPPARAAFPKNGKDAFINSVAAAANGNAPPF